MELRQVANSFVGVIETPKAEPIQTFQSRWGYHPVSYEDFQILRILHRLHWRAVYAAACWRRWKNKEPRNRHGPEPVVNRDFVDPSKVTLVYHDTKLSIANQSAIGQRGKYVARRKLQSRKLGIDIVRDLKMVRTPIKDPADVKSIPMYIYREFFSRTMEVK